MGIGAVVGHGGAVVSKMQAELRCKINVAKNKGRFRVVCLGGFAEAISKTVLEMARKTAEKAEVDQLEVIFCVPHSGAHRSRCGNRETALIDGRKVEAFRVKGSEEELVQIIPAQVPIIMYIAELCINRGGIEWDGR